MKKFMNKVVGYCKAVKDKALGLFVGAGALMAGATESKAEVTFDEATKSFAGEFDLTPYYSALGIIVGAIAIVAAISLAIKQLRSVR